MLPPPLPPRKSRPPPRPALLSTPSLDVVDLTATRAFELRQLRQAAAAINTNRRVFQQLSWHRRRRTMSHSSRRMPVSMRSAHRRELERQGIEEKKKGGKMKMRKYRKKARFLMSVRKLNGRKEGWLETHVWFAKRFRMGELAGGKVAQRCNDRGLRSCWRGVKSGCLGMDASYLEVVEVVGQSVARLKERLREVMGKEDGGRVCVDPAIGGRRVVRGIWIYGSERRIVGGGDLIWRKGEARVWIWVRPEVLKGVVNVFEGVEGVRVEVVKSKPVLFRLVGPRAGIVLKSVLGIEDGDGKFIAGVRSAACLPEGVVFVGKCKDPRVGFPKKNMAECAKGVGMFGDEVGDAFRQVGEWELWEERRREYWYEYMLNGKEKGVDMPFLLLQRGGRNGFGAGWDLVVPGGWGMAFWTTIMYANGNRAMGMEEMRMICLEAGWPLFPEESVDSEAGCAILREEEQRLKEVYSRRPKGKRVNYQMYRFESPMFPDLAAVAMKEREREKSRMDAAPVTKKARQECKGDPEMVGDGAIRIVRGARELQIHLGEGVYNGLRPPIRGRKGGRRVNVDCAPGDKSFLYFSRVRVKAYGRGVPVKNAVLYMATSGDLKAMRENGEKRYGGFRERAANGGEGSDGKETLREMMGYVLYGGFSLGEGEGIGIGIVSVSGLRRILEEGGGFSGRTGGALMLFRNVCSLHYRGAVVQLIC